MRATAAEASEPLSSRGAGPDTRAPPGAPSTGRAAISLRGEPSACPHLPLRRRRSTRARGHAASEGSLRRGRAQHRRRTRRPVGSESLAAGGAEIDSRLAAIAAAHILDAAATAEPGRGAVLWRHRRSTWPPPPCPHPSSQRFPALSINGGSKQGGRSRRISPGLERPKPDADSDRKVWRSHPPELR